MNLTHYAVYSPSPAGGRGVGERAAFSPCHTLCDGQKAPLPDPPPLAGEGVNQHAF